MNKGTTRHPDGGCISYDKSEEPRQGQLGKTEEGAEVPQWYKIFEAEIEHGEHGDVKMVCRWVAQHTPGLQRTQGSAVQHGKGSNHELFEEVETEHLKLNGEQARYRGHVHA